MEHPAMRMASLPSMGAIAMADSLARFYGMLAGDGFFASGNALIHENHLGQRS